MTKLLDKRWVDRKDNLGASKVTAKSLSEQLGISVLVAQTILNRKIQTVEEARRFLFPERSQLHDPFLLKDMDKAVERIVKACENNEMIYIYGDYDVDGVSSTITLMLYFKPFYPNIHFYIPDRSEGYGLNKKALSFIKEQGADLVITVDCGITATEEALHCKEIGLDIIITDHHDAPKELPDAIAVINPKREDDTYPYKGLAGAGVAYKLAVALQSRFNVKDFSPLVEELLDITAFGTVADIMPLTGENRVIVKNGLEILSDHENVRRGFKELIEVSGLTGKKITAGHIGFQLGPRVNAQGRLFHVKPAVDMFLTDSEEEALALAKQVDRANQERQAIQDGIFEDALAELPEPEEFKDRVIVLGSENWHTGIKGIVASKILERYYKPVLLFHFNGDKAEGSARSIEGYNIKEALDESKEHLLKYGGHPAAAGMTLLRTELDAFRNKMNEVAFATMKEEDLIPKVRHDGEINLRDITFQTVEHLRYLEPFGQGNASPSFKVENAVVLEARTIGKEQNHLKFKVQQSGHIMDVIAFGMGHLRDELLQKDTWVDIIGSIDINEFNGKSTLQMSLIDIKVRQKKRDSDLLTLDEIFEKANEFIEANSIVEKDFFHTKIVGVTFEERQKLVQQLKVGEELHLRREPDNPVDKNAIQIVKEDGRQVGYLKAKLAKHLAKHLDKGLEYLVTVTDVSSIEGGDTTGANILVEKKGVEREDQEHIENTELRDALSRKSDAEVFNEIKSCLLGGKPFRPKQIESITHLLSGMNTASIMGTGRGKSAIFQTVASFKAIKEGKSTIIVYPLRALVNDQLAGMQEKLAPLGLRVFKGTGDMKADAKQSMWDTFAEGKIDILLTTPEFLSYHREKFQTYVDQIGFIVIDEGHHIGKATTTYRPAYKELADVAESLNHPLFAVMTATCSDDTFKVINETIHIDKVVIDPYVRANLTIQDSRGLRQKEPYILDVVRTGDKTIIYVNSREKTVELAKSLRKKLPSMADQIGYYHAGLDSENRHFIERLFRDGKIKVIVSTSAFGEGIDIPDIRHVIHYHMTFNEIEFNQESGRAGRDGEKSYVHLLFGELDERINTFIVKKGAPSKEILKMLYSYLRQTSNNGEYQVLIDLDDLSRRMVPSLPDEILVNDTIFVSLAIFKELGFIEFSDSADIYYVTFIPPSGKIELSNSLRFIEGQQEVEEFLSFAKWVLSEDSLSLLRALNKPIYPVKLG